MRLLSKASCKTIETMAGAAPSPVTTALERRRPRPQCVMGRRADQDGEIHQIISRMRSGSLRQYWPGSRSRDQIADNKRKKKYANTANSIIDIMSIFMLA